MERSLLDQVLNDLYDFGDDVAPGRTLKKKKKQQQQQQGKTRVDEEDKEVCDVGCGDGAEDAETEERLGTAPVVHPDAHRIQNAHVEVVTFQDPSKKTRVQQKHTSALNNEPKVKEKEETNKDNSEELSFEKTRLEVHRFGVRGYRKEKQRSLEQERAIMLGAKPPKRQYVNYKTLQHDIQDKKKKAMEEVQPEQKKNKKKNSKPGDKKTKKKKTMPAVFGSSAGPASMGRFKGGMLSLSSKEIEKINGPI